MASKLFRIYVAVSLDGYIARPNGAVDWLDQYDPAEFDFESFLSQIGTLVIGRKTFDQVMSFGDWPYEDKRTIVLTSRPLGDNAPQNAEAYGGSLLELVESLRADPSGTGDVWIVGGASVVTQFLFAGLADQIEMFVIPVILGEGIPLFGKDAARENLVPTDLQHYPSGVVRMEYRLS